MKLARSYGYSVLRVNSGDVKLQVTATAPGAFNIVPDGSYLFLLFRDDATGMREVQKVESKSFLVQSIVLGSPPISIGSVPQSKRMFVNQAHPDGRITFIDWVATRPAPSPASSSTAGFRTSPTCESNCELDLRLAVGMCARGLLAHLGRRLRRPRRRTREGTDTRVAYRARRSPDVHRHTTEVAPSCSTSEPSSQKPKRASSTCRTIRRCRCAATAANEAADRRARATGGRRRGRRAGIARGARQQGSAAHVQAGQSVRPHRAVGRRPLRAAVQERRRQALDRQSERDSDRRLDQVAQGRRRRRSAHARGRVAALGHVLTEHEHRR